MTNFTKYLPLLITIFVFNACRNIQPPTSPAETADVIGRAELQSYILPLASSAGITITVENTSFSALTDDSGMFEFKGIPDGTYNIHFSKAGYGDVYWYGKSIQGGGNAPVYWTENTADSYNSGTAWLIQRPSLVTTLQTATIQDSDIYQPGYPLLKLTGSYVGNDTNSIAIFFSHHSNVSSTPGTYERYTVLYVSRDLTPGVYATPAVRFDPSSQTFAAVEPLIWGNFHSGDSVYISCNALPEVYQGANSTFEGDYYDAIRRVWVLTCIDQTPSPVIGLKIP